MKTILLADDNKRICTLVRSLFYKFRIYEVKDGEEAIGKVFEIQPDPIILDLMMHHINGLKAASKLRQMKVKVPIILLQGTPARFLQMNCHLKL